MLIDIRVTPQVASKGERREGTQRKGSIIYNKNYVIAPDHTTMQGCDETEEGLP